MTECTTHHFACDCREEKFKQLEQENAALRELTSTLGAPNHINIPVEKWRELRETLAIEQERSLYWRSIAARKQAQP